MKRIASISSPSPFSAPRAEALPSLQRDPIFYLSAIVLMAMLVGAGFTLGRMHTLRGDLWTRQCWKSDRTKLQHLPKDRIPAPGAIDATCIFLPLSGQDAGGHP